MTLTSSCWRRLVIAGVPLLASGCCCSSAELTLLEELFIKHNHEVRRLQRELRHALSIDSLIESARAPVDPKWGMPAPRFAGSVTSVAGYSCTLEVHENRFGKDIAAVVSQAPFRIAIYDDDGFKAEAIAVFIDAATGGVVCRLMFTKGEVEVVEGDLVTGL